VGGAALLLSYTVGYVGPLLIAATFTGAVVSLIPTALASEGLLVFFGSGEQVALPCTAWPIRQQYLPTVCCRQAPHGLMCFCCRGAVKDAGAPAMEQLGDTCQWNASFDWGHFLYALTFTAWIMYMQLC
jgi:hypothetical protein